MAQSVSPLCPAELENITLPNRFVRSATELFCAGEDGHVSPWEAAAYEALKGEPIGTVITANTCVSPEGRSGVHQNAFWDESYMDDQRRILSAARSGERKVLLQLGHGGIRAEGHNGGRIVFSPDNLRVIDMEGIAGAFARAAKMAQEIGFDGVQVHAAHSYLLSQMFYTQYNHRTDRYGGSVENRCRLLLEVIAAVKIECGDEFPVFVKMNGTNALQNAQYLLEFHRAAELLRREGVEALEVSGYESSPKGIPTAPYFLREAESIVDTGLPVLLVGGIRTLADVNTALSRGITAVSLCRPLLRSPHAVSELLEGKPPKCTGCDRCHAGGEGRAIRCPVYERETGKSVSN